MIALLDQWRCEYPAVFACKAADEESDEEDEAEENQDSWPFHLIPT